MADNKIISSQTKAIVSARTEEVAVMILELKSRKYIEDMLMDKYNIKKSTVCHIVANAYKLIKNNYPVDRESIVSTHLNHYYKLAADAAAILDVKGSVAALQAIEKLLKLHTENPLVQMNSLNIQLDSVSTEDLIGAIKKITEESKT